MQTPKQSGAGTDKATSPGQSVRFRLESPRLLDAKIAKRRNYGRENKKAQ